MEKQGRQKTDSLTCPRCNETRAEEISLLITKMVTGDTELLLSFVEGEGCRELMVFIEPPSQRTTVTRVKKMNVKFIIMVLEVCV